MSDEHFCTMYDADFLPMGLALNESLCKHSPDARLWVLCLDRTTERVLQALKLPNVRAISLQEVETDELRAARKNRSLREFYWTLTPWIFGAVFDRDSTASRVTYVDADLYFFGSPAVILKSMAPSHRVLITHHAYAPEYDYSSTSGAFCVQFITVTRTPEAGAVVAWWRDRCLEWCYARFDGYRFGDQRYLESWPQMLGDALAIIHRAEWTGAPWNACLAERREGDVWDPVFYHFHGFRYLSGDRVLLFPMQPNYVLGPKTERLYRAYVAAVRRASRAVRQVGFRVDGLATPPGLEDFDPWSTVLRRFGRLLKRRLLPVPRRPIVSIR